MATKMFKESVPSDVPEILEAILGENLERLVRYSWIPLNEAVDEYNIKEEDAFSLTAGPVLIYFKSGLVIGASSRPDKNSVTLWVEKNELGELDGNPLENRELFPIDAKNSTKFWSCLAGKKVVSIRGINSTPRNAKLEELPNEVGLVFVLESGEEFVLSHGLHDGTDDFSVITMDQISKDIVPELVDVVLY